MKRQATAKPESSFTSLFISIEPPVITTYRIYEVARKRVKLPAGMSSQTIVILRGNCPLSSRNVFFLANPAAAGSVVARRREWRLHAARRRSEPHLSSADSLERLNPRHQLRQ